jgi:hypothetical protein
MPARKFKVPVLSILGGVLSAVIVIAATAGSFSHDSAQAGLVFGFGAYFAGFILTGLLTGWK